MSKRAAEDIIGDAEKKICTEEAKAENGNHGVADEAKAVDAKVEITLSNKPTLYHSPHYSSTRPLIVIEELGLKDKINVKMCLDKEHKKPEFIAINAHGTVRTPLSPQFSPSLSPCASLSCAFAARARPPSTHSPHLVFAELLEPFGPFFALQRPIVNGTYQADQMAHHCLQLFYVEYGALRVDWRVANGNEIKIGLFRRMTTLGAHGRCSFPCTRRRMESMCWSPERLRGI